MSKVLSCFKYRTPTVALRCLAEGSLYFAKPSQLNDAFEAKYIHATQEEFVRVITKTVTEINQQRRGQPLAFSQQSMAKMAESYARECQHLKEFTDNIGIFSTAKRPDHQAMWAYYADNSSGVCFELEWSHTVAEEYQLWATDVEYHDKPRIHNRAEDWREIFLKLAESHPFYNLEQLYHLSLEEEARRKWGILTASRAVSVKHTDWMHEQEIRILAPKSGAQHLLHDVLKCVHFVGTSGEHWAAIMQLLYANYPKVEMLYWESSHGVMSKTPTPMEFRLVKI